MKLVVAAAFLFVAVQAGRVPGQLLCFTCSYTDQKRCIVANNLPTENCEALTDQKKLDGFKTFCVKTIDPEAKYNKKYDRSCAVVEPEKDYCETFLSSHKDSKCFICEHDLCNDCKRNDALVWVLCFGVVASLLGHLIRG